MTAQHTPTAKAFLSAAELKQATQGQWLNSIAPPEDALYSLNTDTRTIQQNDAFLALYGERFDGHAFLPQAFESGATLAIAEPGRLQAQTYPQPVLLVSQTVQAYLDIARFYRRKRAAQSIANADSTFKAESPLKVIALTGSSGKTTLKGMLLAAFSSVLHTQASLKNHNNEIGVSQTLLSLNPDTQLLIVEMGMRGLGQIDQLTRAAEPDVAIVLNVGPAHIGLLGSINAIAQAKCEIFNGLDPECGIAILNGDDAPLMQTFDQHPFAQTAPKHHILAFRHADIETKAFSATETKIKVQGTWLSVPLPGEHMVANLLAVATVAQALNIPLKAIAPGLASFTPEEGRGEVCRTSAYPGLRVINDAYNANPASMRAALQAALLHHDAAVHGRLVLVLSAMNELGEHSQSYHAALGQWLAEQSEPSALITVGEEAKWLAEAAAHATFPVIWVPTVEQIPDKLRQLGLLAPNQPATLYLKGSRSFKLEALTHYLEANPDVVSA
ncbi:MAG: UDP-N-acetylmuramoyl-tripeptide--D-alanyl-D-alanine ligase [Vampirovibrionales bacterium]|nr:UDP-N-acetylmuramoyl-tripeptide--D-alanyl-D-alanine ligase [Vampirovibrionales bacterium]